MATPAFQHGKNGFLAIGYESSSTVNTGSITGGSLTVTPTAGTLLAGGISLADKAISTPTSTVYGAFVNGIPVGTATQFATATSSYTLSVNSSAVAGASSPVLPMVNLSPFINDISFPTQIDTPETTTFSQAGVKTYIVGLKGYTITFAGMYDPTAGSSTTTGGTDAIMNSLISFQDAGKFISFIYGPSTPGAFTGQTPSVMFYGQALLNKYDLKSGVNAVISFDGELQVTGVVTRTIL
jgi:hypothetical protein